MLKHKILGESEPDKAYTCMYIVHVHYNASNILHLIPILKRMLGIAD